MHPFYPWRMRTACGFNPPWKLTQLPAMRYTRPRMQAGHIPSTGRQPASAPPCWSCRFRWPAPCPRRAASWPGLPWSRLSGRSMRVAEDDRHPLRTRLPARLRSAASSGIAGNCYWIYDTMLIYGGLPPVALGVGPDRLQPRSRPLLRPLRPGRSHFVRRTTGSTRLALAFAPFLWTALDLAAARITSVPWDQLGYSQVDNALVNSARALDRRLRHQLCPRCRQRPARRRLASAPRP